MLFLLLALFFSATPSFPLDIIPRASSPPAYLLHAFAPNSPIANRAINATGTGFYINLPSAIYCPVPAPDCAHFSNKTALVIGGGAYLYVEVPAGQDVYVAQNGQLSFTIAHEEGNYPPGAYTTGFEIIGEEMEVGETLGFFPNGTSGNEAQWVGCPQYGSPYASGAYQVFAQVLGFNASNCPGAIGLEIELKGTKKFGAFEYA